MAGPDPSFAARLLSRHRGGYFTALKVLPGVAAGLCAGGSGLAYLALSLNAPPHIWHRIGVAYLFCSLLALCADNVLCNRQYRRVRAWLAGRPVDAMDALLRETVALPRLALRRLFLVGQGIVVAIALLAVLVPLVERPVDLVQLVIAAQVAVFVNVVAAYLATAQLARPLFNELFDELRGQGGDPLLPETELRANFLGRKILYVFTVLQALPFVLVVAFIGKRAGLGQNPLLLPVLAVAVASTALALLLTIWVSRSLSRPIRTMVAKMDAVASRDYSTRFVVYADDELGLLANAFNRMLLDLERYYGDLRQKNEELRRWSETLEQRVRERTRELEETKKIAIHNEKLAGLGTLLSGVGHELNNPISQILRNGTNLLRDLQPALQSLQQARRMIETEENGAAKENWLAEARRLNLDRRVPFMEQALQDISRGAERSLSLVRSLNVFSRSSGDAPARLRLRPLVDETLNLLSSDARAAGVRFLVDVPPDFEMMGFEDALLQVLLNLLANAALAMEGKGDVAVSARNEGPTAVLTVADEGPGVPEELQEKIFTPFFTTRRQGQGSGLGLAIVHGIVCEKHGGEVRVRNRTEGHGAIFEVRIPLDLGELYRKAGSADLPSGGGSAQPEHL
jgi:signal transduction histidine kinase